MSAATIAPLVRAAIRAGRQAHAPYSGYRVGAALLAADGRVFTGCNVENASYGLTLCAERAAVCAAVAAGARRFTALAVTASGAAVPFPCGACRQVLAEFCPAEMPVHVARAAKPRAIRTLTMAELLPHGFRLRPQRRPATHEDSNNRAARDVDTT
jgi:cytidine deaminase